MPAEIRITLDESAAPAEPPPSPGGEPPVPWEFGAPGWRGPTPPSTMPFPRPPAPTPPADDDYHMPAWDKAPAPGAPVPVPKPTPAPVPPPLPLSRTPAFDRPQPVIVVGPKPLPVTMADGAPGGARPAADRPPKQEDGWVKFIADRLASGVRSAGVAGVGVAQNRVTPALTEGIGAAAAGLARLGPAGAAAGAALKVLSVGIEATKATIDALVNRGRELAGFNAQLAGASATADVRKLQADMGEAQRIGPQLAKLIDTQSKTEATFQRLLEPIKGFLAEQLAGFMERSLKVTVGILEGIDKLTAGVVPGLSDLVKDVKKIMAGDMGDFDRLADGWLRDAKNMLGPPPAPLPAGGAGGGPPIAVP